MTDDAKAAWMFVVWLSGWGIVLIVVLQYAEVIDRCCG